MNMKIPKEYSLLFIIGLFILAYVLDLVVDPMVVQLKNPYLYFQSETMMVLPFSSLSIFIKALAIFLMPLWLLSFIDSNSFFKPAILLIVSVLLQLYAVQDITAKSRMIPMEWSISMAAAGLALMVPTIYFFFKAVVVALHKNLTNAKMDEALKQAQDNPKSEEDITKQFSASQEDLD